MAAAPVSELALAMNGMISMTGRFLAFFLPMASDGLVI